MKLQLLTHDLSAARRSAMLLLGLLCASLISNIVLAVFAVRMAGHERVVIVPPTVHKTFWVDSDSVSAEYLEQMAYFVIQLILNVTPQGASSQARLLLQYASPAGHGELRSALSVAAERLRRDNAATLFSTQDLMADPQRLRVGVRGQLTTFVGDRRVADTAKGYALEFQYSGGRLLLKSFRETPHHDPLETQTPAAASDPRR